MSTTCEDTLNSIQSDVSSSVSMLSNHQGYFDNISDLVGKNNSSLSPTSPLQTNVEDVLKMLDFYADFLYRQPISSPQPSLSALLIFIKTKVESDIIPNLEELLSNNSLDLTDLETNIAKNNTDINAFKTLYEEHDIPTLNTNIETILQELTSLDENGNPFSLFGFLNTIFNLQSDHTTLLTSLENSLSTNETASNNIFNNTEAIYTLQSSQNENIVSLISTVSQLKNTDLSSIETLISQIPTTDLKGLEAEIAKNNTDIKAFKTLYEEHDRVQLSTDISNILKSVYNATPDTKTVLDYLNANDTLQAQHTIKIDALQTSLENIYTAINTTFQNTEAIYLQNSSLLSKIDDMQTKIDTLESKLDALQNFDPTTIENKLNKILNFLGQEI